MKTTKTKTTKKRPLGKIVKTSTGYAIAGVSHFTDAEFEKEVALWPASYYIMLISQSSKEVQRECFQALVKQLAKKGETLEDTFKRGDEKGAGVVQRPGVALGRPQVRGGHRIAPA